MPRIRQIKLGWGSGLVVSVVWASTVVVPVAATLSSSWQHPHSEEFVPWSPNEDRAGMALVPPSPECWRSAMALFSSGAASPPPYTAAESSHASTTTRWDSSAQTTLCQEMDEMHQKLLALLIAKCHLDDLGKSLLQDPDAWDECRHRAWQDREALLRCLRQLTDAGVHAYTHYVSYVQQLCTRLTQELVLQSQAHSHRMLADQYERLAGDAVEHLRFLGEAARKCADRAASEVLEQYRHWANEWQANATSAIRHALGREVRSQLRVQLQAQLGPLLERETRSWSRRAERLLDRARQREEATRRQHQAWTDQQGRLWKSHLGEWEQLQLHIRQHHDRLDYLTEVVRNATQAIFPVAQVQAVLTAVTGSYWWLAILRRLMCQWALIWLVTRLLRCPRIRSTLVAVAVLEALLEILMTSAVAYKIGSEAMRLQVTEESRKWSFCLKCAMCFVGFLLTFHAPQGEGATTIQSKDSDPATTLHSNLIELCHRYEQALRNMEAAFDDKRNAEAQTQVPKTHPNLIPGYTYDWSNNHVNSLILPPHPIHHAAVLAPSATCVPAGSLHSPARRTTEDHLLSGSRPAPHSPPASWAAEGTDPLVLTRALALVQPSPWLAPNRGAAPPWTYPTCAPAAPYPHPVRAPPLNLEASPPSPHSTRIQPPFVATLWSDAGSPAVSPATAHPSPSPQESRLQLKDPNPSPQSGRKRCRASPWDYDEEAETGKKPREHDRESSE